MVRPEVSVKHEAVSCCKDTPPRLTGGVAMSGLAKLGTQRSHTKTFFQLN